MEAVIRDMVLWGAGFTALATLYIATIHWLLNRSPSARPAEPVSDEPEGPSSRAAGSPVRI